MSEIKSLADQLRGKINEPEKTKTPPILETIRAYDNSDHRNLVHTRFDAQTVKTMNHFKMATGIDATKLVAFAVKELFGRHPELKTIIKQYFQQLEL